jgi:hypothetical protein
MLPPAVDALLTKRPHALATHTTWSGPTQAGRPVALIRGRLVDVMSLLWVAYARRPLPSLHVVRPTCRRQTCVRLEHLAAFPPTNPPPGWIAPPFWGCVHGHSYLELRHLTFEKDRYPTCRTCRLQYRAARITARGLTAEQHRVDPVTGWFTHCSAGHPMEGANVVVEKDGTRRCRTCRCARARERRARRKAAAAVAE